MTAERKFFERRTLIQIFSVVIPIGVLVLFGPVNNGVLFGIYLVFQLAAGLDVILLLLGRYLPRATLWAIRLEVWLGLLPWSAK